MNYQAIKYWNNRGQRSNFEIGGGGGEGAMLVTRYGGGEGAMMVTRYGGGRGNVSDSIWGGHKTHFLSNSL